MWGKWVAKQWLACPFVYVNISYSALTYRELRDVVPCFDVGSHYSCVTLTVASEGFSDVIY
jgi:hypothetical protein